MTKQNIYISGPMANIKNNNFDKFFEIEDELYKEGYNVINPARLSTFLSLKNRRELEDIPRKEFMIWDIKAILECDCIYMLDGWWDSEGAMLEFEIAKTIGLKIIYERSKNDTS